MSRLKPTMANMGNADPAAPSSCAPTELGVHGECRNAGGLDLARATHLLLRNAARFGDTDAMPRAVEHTILSEYPDEVARAVWAQPPEGEIVSNEQLPLSRLGARTPHLTHPATFLRFGSVILAGAHHIEQMRSSASTAGRLGINWARSRLLASGAYERRDSAIRVLQAEFPRILRSDISACFPSIRSECVEAALPATIRGRIMQEVGRLGLPGLPIGSVPIRWPFEAVLSGVDERLTRDGLRHVRHMDDICIGVGSDSDAPHAISVFQEALATIGLTPNKTKTEVMDCATYDPGLPKISLEELRIKLVDPKSADRIGVMAGLRKLREEARDFAGRERSRWLTVLCDALALHPESLRGLLWTIQSVAAGSVARELAPALTPLLYSDWSVVRAEAIAFLCRHGHRESLYHARDLATHDASALVRREALLGLVRLRARDAVVQVLRAPVASTLDRTTRLVAAGALGLSHGLDRLSPYEALLSRVAREYGPGGVLAGARQPLLGAPAGRHAAL